jgi:two-component system chemotaxis response regulator CheY
MRNIVKNCFIKLKLPCNFVEASDGQMAFEKLSPMIDLICCDWNMPNLLGIDFVKKVRAVEKFKKIPIIMVTSEAARYNVIEAMASGATDYLVKPIDEDKFKDKIFKVMSQR